MAPKYRAGTAFVEVVPVFEGAQRGIGEKIRQAFGDEKNYKGLDKKINDAITKAMGGLPEEIKKQMRHAREAAEKELKETGKVSAKSFEKGLEEGFEKETGGPWADRLKRMSKDLRGAMANTNKDSTREFIKLRANLVRELKVIDTAFTDTGTNSRKEMLQAYEAASKLIKQMDAIPKGSARISRFDRDEISGLTRVLKQYAKSIEQFTDPAVLKEQERAQESAAKTEREQNRKREAEARRHMNQLHAEALRDNQRFDTLNRQREAAERRHESELRRIAAERRKRNAADAAREALAAERGAERRWRSNLSGVRGAIDSAADATRGVSRQERLVNRQGQVIGRLNQRATDLINRLSRIDAMSINPRVRLHAGTTIPELMDIQRKANEIASDEFNVEFDARWDNDEDVRQQIARLKKFADTTLRDVRFDVEMDDGDVSRGIANLRAQLELIRDVDIDVDLNHDQARKAFNHLRRMAADVRDIEIDIADEKAQRDIDTIQRSLLALKDKEVGVDINYREAMAHIKAIEVAVERLDGRDIDINVDFDRDAFRQFRRQAFLANAQVNNLGRSIKRAGISFGESTQAFRVFSPMMAGIAAAGAPIVSLLGGIAGGLGAIVSVAPGAAAALSPLFFAFGGLEDATEDYAKAQEALKIAEGDRTKSQNDAIEVWRNQADTIGEATISFIEYTDVLKSEMSTLQTLAREGLLPGVESGLRRIIETYSGPFGAFLHETGEQIGEIANRWSMLLTTDSASKWFSRVGEDSERYLGNMADIVENVTGGIAALVDVFRPFGQRFMDWLVDITAGFERWARSLDGLDKFHDFMDAVMSTMPGMRRLLSNVADLFVNLVIAVEPFTIAVLDAANGALEFINAMDPAALQAILGAVIGLTGGIMILSGVMAGFGATYMIIQAAAGSTFTLLAASLGAFVALNTAAVGAMELTGGGAVELTGVMGHLGEVIIAMSEFSGRFIDTLGVLYEAIEPLLPVLGEFIADVVDLGLSFGGVFLEAIEAIAVPIGNIIEWFAGLDEGIQTVTITAGLFLLGFGRIKPMIDVVVGSFMGLVGAVTRLGGPLYYGVAGMAEMGGNLGRAGDEAKKATPRMDKFRNSLAGIDRASLVLTGLIVGLTTLNQLFAWLNPDPAIEGIDNVTAALEGLSVAGVDANEALGGMFNDDGEGIGSWLDKSRRDVDSLSDAFIQLRKASGVGGWLREAGAEMDTLFGVFGPTQLDAIQESFEDLDQSLATMSQGSFQDAATAFSKIADEARLAGLSNSEILEIFSDYHQELKNTAAALGDVQLTEEEYIAWMSGNVPPAIEEQLEAQGRYQDGLAGTEDNLAANEQATRDLIEASDELAGRYLSQEEANLRYQEVLLSFEERMQGATRTLAENTEEGIANRRAFKEMADVTIAKAEADLKATGDADAYRNALWTQREALYDLAIEFGMTEEEASIYSNTIMGIDRDIDSRVDLNNDKAMIEKIRDIVDELDEIKDKSIDLTVNVTPNDPYGIFKKGPGKSPGPWHPDAGGYVFPNADGNLLMPMARGGLTSMSPIAQMVSPNTWRVVGDRMDVDEAYIPLDGSQRSWDILMETLLRMPKLMHDGGILGFAAGAVAPPAASAEGGSGATVPGSEAIAQAFADLMAAVSVGWAEMLDTLLLGATEFFASMTDATVAWTGKETARWAEFHLSQSEATTAFLASNLTAWGEHRMVQSEASSAFLDSEHAKMTDFFNGRIIPLTQTSHQVLQSAWRLHFDTLNLIGDDFRTREYQDMGSFYDLSIQQMQGFGSDARNEWSRIWNDIADSADDIFAKLPPRIGNTLSDIGRKMNTHIVDPFNKVIDDMDIEKVPELGKFPTQSYATGGILPGYTPGRDVHRFFSSTGGALELSGGEAILRPEASALLGEDWVNAVNRAAINGGVRGVQSLLMPTQSFADGGVWRNLWGIVHEQFPWARLTSAYRPGSGRSYHARGMAVDLAGPRPMDANAMMRIFNFIHDNYGNSAELIYTPARGRNILNGAYHTYSPAVQRDHFDHVHWAARQAFNSIIGPPTGQSAMGMVDIVGQMEGWLKDLSGDIGDGFLESTSMGIAQRVFSEVAKQRQEDFITDHAYSDPGAPGAGVERWRSLVKQALEHVGQPATEAMINIVLRRMNQESGGNPRAINLWDVNARRGTPSKSLMQVIDPTFAAYRDRSLGNDIWDPFQNIVASMRYALAQYGSLPAAYNRPGGYAEGTPYLDLSPEALLRDTGGPLPTGYSVVLNNLGHEETILPETTSDVAALFRDVEVALQGDHGQVVFHDARFEGNPNDIADTLERRKRLAFAGTSTMMG